MHVYALTAVNELDHPETVFTVLEAHLEVTLVTVSVLVPKRYRRTVIVCRSLLVHRKGSVYGAGEEEDVVAPWDGLDVPFQVGLVYPRIRRDSGLVVRVSSEDVKEGPKLALDRNRNVRVYKRKRRDRKSVV